MRRHRKEKKNYVSNKERMGQVFWGQESRNNSDLLFLFNTLLFLITEIKLFLNCNLCNLPLKDHKRLFLKKTIMAQKNVMQCNFVV